MVSLKRYVIGALIAFFATLAVSLLFGAPIAGWLSGFKGQAGTLGPIAVVLIDPLLWILQNVLLGAVVAGLAWPLIALELAGLFVVVIIVLGFPSASNVVDPNQIPRF